MKAKANNQIKKFLSDVLWIDVWLETQKLIWIENSFIFLLRLNWLVPLVTFWVSEKKTFKWMKNLKLKGGCKNDMKKVWWSNQNFIDENI